VVSHTNEAETLHSVISDLEMCDEEFVIRFCLPVRILYDIYDYLITGHNILYDIHLFIFCTRCGGQDVFMK